MKKMFFVALAITVIATTYTKAQQSESKIKRFGVLVKKEYGKHPGGLPQYLLGSDDIAPAALSFPKQTFTIYKDHWKNAYGTNNDADIQAAAQNWTLAPFSGTDMEFYNTYKVGFFDQNGKLDYFRRMPHRKGDADGCTKDELFYFNPSGKIDASDLCFNPTLYAPVIPIGTSQGATYAGNSYTLPAAPGNVTSTASITGGTQGQPIIILNNILPAPAVAAAVAEPKIVYMGYQPEQLSRERVAYREPQPQYYDQSMMMANNGPQQVFVANQPSWLNRTLSTFTGTLGANLISDFAADKFYGNKQNVFNQFITKNNGGGIRYDNGWTNPVTNGGEFYAPTNPGRGFAVATAIPGLGGGGSGTNTGGYGNGW